MERHGLEHADLAVVGQNHYRGNILALFREHAEPFAQELEIDALIEPEPTNTHDPSAVVVKVRGYVVGYIAQQNAAKVRAAIGSGLRVRLRLISNHDPEHPACSAVVTSVI
jgi:hypothetical protein